MGVLTIASIMIAALLLVIAIYGFTRYSKLNRIKKSFGQALSHAYQQLQHRHDLVLKLIKTAESYMRYEQHTLSMLTDTCLQAQEAALFAKAEPDDIDAINKLLATEARLKKSVEQFLKTIENYPELKANIGMQELIDEFIASENHFKTAQESLNHIVHAYNSLVIQFPNSLYARPLRSL